MQYCPILFSLCINFLRLPYQMTTNLVASVSSVQLLSCVRLCNPVDRSTPGLPVHHQLPEFTQTHVHRVSDAIQPSHLLSFPSPPCLQSFPASGAFHMSQFFTSGGQSIRVSASPLVLPMNIQDWFPLGWTGWESPRDSQRSSPTPQFKCISSSGLRFLHSPILTSIHEHRKNHSLD